MEFYIYLGILIIAACFSLLLGFFSNFSRLDFFFSIFFAPLGAMTRWGVSLVLNKAEVFFSLLLLFCFVCFVLFCLFCTVLFVLFCCFVLFDLFFSVMETIIYHMGLLLLI